MLPHKVQVEHYYGDLTLVLWSRDANQEIHRNTYLIQQGSAIPDHYHRAQYWIQTQQYAKAIQDSTMSLTMSNLRGMSYYVVSGCEYRAMAWIALGEYQKAINDCDMAIAVNPKSYMAFMWRGLAFHRLG